MKTPAFPLGNGTPQDAVPDPRTDFVPSRPLTREDLLELESAPKTGSQVFWDKAVCFLPVVAALLALAEYHLVPDLEGNTRGPVYTAFLCLLMGVLSVAFAASFRSRRVFVFLRYKSPFYTFIFLALAGYDYLTLKTGILILPYFPWVDQILTALVTDRGYLAECSRNTFILLFTGYASGASLGLVTGIACGYSRKVNYWIAPFMKLLGAIPSTTWLPVVMVLAASLFSGSVFIIALGVWFSVTLATLTGITSIDKAYFDTARTLGARGNQLVFRVAVPFALPNIFQGLVQGMSSACTALMVAEMIGVESGLGWYISWQKSWAHYGKMYAAIVLICVFFVLVNFALARARKYILRWQEGVVRDFA